MIQLTSTVVTPYSGITLSSVKEWLLLDAGYTDDDTLITGLISQVLSIVEGYLNTTFGTFDYILNFWDRDSIELLKQPIQGTISITSVVTDSGDALDYTTKGNMLLFSEEVSGVIDYTVTAPTIPDGLKLGMLNFIKAFYNDREKIGLSPDEMATINIYRKKIWI